MRRTIFMAMLAAVLVALVPPAAHAQGTTEILRDCADDDTLQGDYSVSAMRTARNNLPAELEEYSACRDVLTAAINDKTKKPASTGGDSSGGGTFGGGGTGGGDPSSGGGTGSGGGVTATPDPTTPTGPVDSGREVPATPQEWAAITEAQKGVDPNPSDVKQVSPGASRMNAEVGRNALPGSLIGVLALIAAAVCALLAAPLIRKRGLGPRQT
jgi:hypothetical protein